MVAVPKEAVAVTPVSCSACTPTNTEGDGIVATTLTPPADTVIPPTDTVAALVCVTVVALFGVSVTTPVVTLGVATPPRSAVLVGTLVMTAEIVGATAVAVTLTEEGRRETAPRASDA